MYTTDLLVSFLYVKNQKMIRIWVVNNYWTLYINEFKECLEVESYTHPWPISKSKFNLKSDCVNLVAPAYSPFECLLYLPDVRAIQYKLGLERLTQLGNSNILQLPVPITRISEFSHIVIKDILNDKNRKKQLWLQLYVVIRVSTPNFVLQCNSNG